MDIKRFLIVIISGMLVFQVGCSGPKQVNETSRPVKLMAADTRRAMEVSEDVLRSMSFTIDKMDFEKGIIITKPLSGAQFFEFWRKDNTSSYASGEANLHSIRRWVVLEFVQQDQEVVASCKVPTQRLSIPESEMSGMSQAASMFTTSDSSLQKLQLNAEQAEDMAWIDLGRDGGLENRVLEMIDSRIKQLEGMN